MLLFLLLCAIVSAPYSVSQDVIAIVNEGLRLIPGCVNNSVKIYHLENLPLLNNTQVWLCSENFTVDTVIEISQGMNIEWIGYGFATFHCQKESQSGIFFNGIHNLTLSRFSVQNCAFLVTPNGDSAENLKTGLAIENCTNLVLNEIIVSDSPGTGLSMFANEGLVRISNCAFESNGFDMRSGGSGLYMEVNAVASSFEGTQYIIEGSNFYNNSAKTGKDEIYKGFTRFDKGGGMCITCLSCENVAFLMIDLKFQQNVADAYGGGLFITYHGSAKNNFVYVFQSRFYLNVAEYGGGLYIGYLHTRLPVLHAPFNCSYLLRSSNFSNNEAIFGGGTSIYSTKTDNMDIHKSVMFENCSWLHNFGHYGSAVSLLPNAWNLYDHGYLPTPVFDGCSIQSNYVVGKAITTENNFYQYSGGAGAFYCSRHNVTFTSKTYFGYNNGTALYLLLCLATFFDSSHIEFISNSGFSGGAIYLLSSIAYFSNNARVAFIGNQASNKGGAIYEEAPLPHIREYSKACFLDYVDNFKNVSDRNISVLFQSNVAGVGNKEARYGHSIYCTSLQPCYTRFEVANKSLNIFTQVGDFQFTSDDPYDIATETDHSKFINNIMWQNELRFIAGKPEHLKFFDVDDLDHHMKTSYLVSITDSNITSGRAYSYVSNYTLSLNGLANDTGNVTLTSTSSRLFSITFKVRMESCPPGFVQQETTQQCYCSSLTVDEYPGISICDLANFHAYRKRGYWVGYEEVASENSLLSGECPAGYCSYDNLQLPDRASIKDLNDHMCTTSRFGKLCGKCLANNSVFYNSLDFDCKKNNDRCSWGWLIYILSELLPVTVIFFVIIFFNLSFTSGLVNGFIFYAQIVEWLHISDFLTVPFSEAAKNMNHAHIFIYRMFSLHFFVLQKFSFCLWRSANALDVLGIRYLQLVYAVLLILIIIIVLDRANLAPCSKLRRKLPALYLKRSSQNGIIHGLSAFLILCYSQCLNTSIMILSSSQIKSRGSMKMSTVVYYNGEIEWLSLRHLKYAIPAITFSLILLVIPPIILLIYPMHFKILALLHLDQIKWISKLFSPLDKLKPFLDSFQSCFKDEYRCFSGLYLIYRLAIQLNMGLIYVHQSYLILQFELVVAFLLHSICQPYKEKLHNVIDSFLFGNLILINGITLYNISVANSGAYEVKDFLLTTWTQVFLIIFPAFVVFGVIAFNICKKLALCFCRSCNKQARDEENDYYPDRLEYSSLD